MKQVRWLWMVAALSGMVFGAGCDDSDDDAEKVAVGTENETDSGDSDTGTDVGDGTDEEQDGSGDEPVAGMTSDMGGGDTDVDETPVDMASADIVDTAIAAGDFTKLAELLGEAGLVDALRGEGPFTVFAPTDAAFAAFEEANPGVLGGLDAEALAEVLKYHVVSGAGVKSSELVDGQLVESLAGPVLAVNLSGDAPMINGATVTTADVEASNGVIHVIDSIILPPGDIVEVASATEGFSQLVAAVDAAGLVETLQGEGPFTVFAPTDDAFAALEATPEGEALMEVLLYHVLPGVVGPLDLANGSVATTAAGAPVLFDLTDGVKINGATITMTNVVAKNGVIHVIDAVIVPPADDIVATAVAAGFGTLADLLTQQELVETLQGEGPFTVFAPTDEAFAALSAVPEGDALTQVLLYHVVDGAIGSGDLVSGEVDTLGEAKLSVEVGDMVMLNGTSTVTTANVLTSNGVIHIIDTVLVPPSE